MIYLSITFPTKNMKRPLILFVIAMAVSVGGFAQLESRKGPNGKFGFTNEEQWAIQPIYDEVNDYYDWPYAFVKLKGKWGIIDQQGKTILPFEYSKIINLDFGDNQLYSVVKNKRYGLVSLSEGKMFAECVYEKPFYFEDGIIPYLGNLAIAYKNKKAGLLNEQGKEVVPCIYDGGKRPFADLDYDYFFLVHQNNKAGVIDTIGRQIVQCQYDDIKMSDSMGEVFEITKNGKHGLCGFDGKEIIAPIYDKSFFFEGEYGVVKLKGKYGVINRKGEAVVPITYLKESEAFDEMMKLYDK
jgi:hypothetical protein